MAHAVLARGSVTQWNACCYNSSDRRWVFGMLHLLPTAIFFEAKNVNSENIPDNRFELFVKFSIVSTVKKASSSFIYPSINVTTTNKITYWFSSFSDRDSVFLVIQHFLHSFLFMGSSDEADAERKNSNKQETSQLGRSLLQNVNDTHKTLAMSASKLSAQGQQLRNASCTMDDIHDDISVASRITSGIDSWFGRWRAPKLLKNQESLHVVKNNDIPYGFHFDVLCSEIQGFKYGPQKECVLRLMTNGVTILDKKQKPVHHFGWKDVSRLRVASPWEIVISKFLIGQADVSFALTAIEMPTVLTEMEKFIPDKMEFMNRPASDQPAPTLYSGASSEADASNTYNTRPTSPPSSSSLASSRARSQLLDRDGRTSHLPDKTCLADDGSYHNAQAMQQETVTEDEMNQLSSTLSSLKSLALDIQKEEDDQLQSLDQLIGSVDRGNDGLTHINKKINTLLK